MNKGKPVEAMIDLAKYRNAVTRMPSYVFPAGRNPKVMKSMVERAMQQIYDALAHVGGPTDGDTFAGHVANMLWLTPSERRYAETSWPSYVEHRAALLKLQETRRVAIQEAQKIGMERYLADKAAETKQDV